MKKFFVLFILFGLVLGSEFIPKDKIQAIAQKFISQRYGPEYGLKDVITYYGIDEKPNAYGFVFQNQEQNITIVMGARYTTSPIGEVYQGEPYCQRFYNRALENLRTKTLSEPAFKHYYYFGAGEEYAGFDVNGKQVLINLRNLQTRNGEDLTKCKSEPILESITREKWERYLKIDDFKTRQSGYVDSVPFIDWVYGCTPTAASMMFWYWDYRGYGKLVDYFFTHWDNPENEWNDCANTNRELAIAMNTDTLTGGTYISNVRPGMLMVANTYNGYSFSASTSPQGGSYNQYVFSWIETEINAQRPCHWSVLSYWYQPFGQYINHSITGVGYEITSTDTFVIVHTTWDNTEPLWPLWTYYGGVYSYDYVVTLIPGGSNPNNIFLTSPQNSIMFKGLKYYLRWNSLGTDINHVKIYYSIGRNGMSYDSLNWYLIDANASNTGRYVWTVPNQDSSFRINLVGLNSSNTRLAADGSFAPIIPSSIVQSSGVHLTSHFDTDGSSGDVVKIGNLLYIADYGNGIVVLDAADSSILDLVGQVKNIGAIKGLYYLAPYLYAVDYLGDTLRIFDLTNPQSPVQIGKVGVLTDPSSVFVLGNYAYLACGANGMAIVDCRTPNAPNQIGIFDSPGQAYNVYVSDTIAYLVDGSRGLRILNVANPANPVEINSYDPNLGVTQGIDKNDDYLYLADGSIGVRILHLTSPTDVESISVYNTPGVARNVRYLNNHLFVTDGTQGVRIINIASPQNPSEVGYLLSKSNATRLSVEGNKIYLADDADGTYLITHDFFGINETEKTHFGQQFTVKCPGIVNINQGLKIDLILKNPLNITVKVYDLDGRFVDLLYQGNMKNGANALFYRGRLSSGVYFLLISDGSNNIIKKVLVVK